MRVRSAVWLGALSVALVAAAACGVHAEVLHEDFAYWYLDDQSFIQTVFDPDYEWIQSHNRRIRVCVQQTVYDANETASILRESFPNDPEIVNLLSGGGDLFLYAYNVTNFGWRDAQVTRGITGFAVNWSPVMPVWVGVAPSTSPNWVGTSFSSPPYGGPAWLWADPGPGIRLGSSAGGFWAVATTGQEHIVDASTMTGNPLDPSGMLFGKTTGPLIPEPGVMLTLVSGLGVMALRGLRRRG